MRRQIRLVGSIEMKRSTLSLLSAVMLLAAAFPASGDDDMIQPGEPFPAFELPAQDGTTVSSADLAGSTYLLFFYPKANTGG